MAKAKESRKRGQRPPGGASDDRSQSSREEGRSSDRQPREEPNRQNIESPTQPRQSERDSSANQPLERGDDGGESQRPGGRGDVSR